MILGNWLSRAELPALEWEEGVMTYGELAAEVDRLSFWFECQPGAHFAIEISNSPEWVILDLACQAAGKVLVPVPPYFSPQQRAHLFAEAGIEYYFSASPVTNHTFSLKECPFQRLSLYQLAGSKTPLVPDGTGKITFTSGSTGNPKGVCLSHQSQKVVAESLVNATGIASPRHLCLLPLSTLLENIAGIYAPLMAGGCIVLRRAESLGFEGVSLTSPERMLQSISEAKPSTLILVPELLQLLVSACSQGWQPPASLLFIAVGGATVPAALIKKARDCRLPVYQGYGLSECVSVNTLNTPAKDNIYSAGTALGHNRLVIEDGEIVITGTLFLGYVNMPESFYPTAVYTGDLAVQTDGFFQIAGRKKNVFINSFGRNISPEWIEGELMATGLFRLVVLTGEARPYCGALLLPYESGLDSKITGQAIAAVNQHLPEYARVKVWQSVPELATDKTLFTANRKLKRDALASKYQSVIDTMYAGSGLISEEIEA